jgi:hypothetical protein
MVRSLTRRCGPVRAAARYEKRFGKVGEKMSIVLEIIAAPGFLEVRATGRWSLVEGKRSFLEMLEAIARHRVRQVLFDGRSVVGNPEIMERFYYGEFAARSVAEFADRGVSRTTQFAYVLEVPMRDPRRFGETVAVNRGMHVATFEDHNNALRWLGVIPADTPGQTT